MLQFLGKTISNWYEKPTKNFPNIQPTADDKNFIDQNREALENLEHIRRDKLRSYIKRKKIGIPLACILMPVTGYIDYWLIMAAGDKNEFGLTFVAMGALYWWVTKPKREYRKEYKKEFLPKVAKLFGNLSYFAERKIWMDTLSPSKIIPDHNEYKAEDYFSGEYKGVDLEFSEIKLIKQKGSGRNRRDVTVFSGLAVLLTVKTKRFFGHTILDHDKGAISEWFKEKSIGMERAEMVDPEFEKIFDAYTNDQVEARYLIDPLMIENLNGLYREYNGEKMAAAFYDNKMLILVSSKYNHFEPADLHIPATNPQSLLNMKHEVGQILSIIDKLSLYDPDEVITEKEKMTA